MSKFIVLDSDKLYILLHEAGVVEEEPANVRRAIIDLEVGRPAKIYLEKFADDHKLNAGLMVERIEQATAAPGEKR